MLNDRDIQQNVGMYYPEFEHDSCGVGFVANINGKKMVKGKLQL